MSCDFNLLDDKTGEKPPHWSRKNIQPSNVSPSVTNPHLNPLQNDAPSHLPNNVSLFLSSFFVSRAVRANQDVENAHFFQMSGDFDYEVSSFVVSAAPHTDVLSMALGSWHSGPEWVGTHSLRVFPADWEDVGHDYPCLMSAVVWANKAPVSQTTVEYCTVNYCFVNPW